MNKEKLFKECLEARKLSYSPYSHFAVGAVVLLKNGETIYGANIENAAYGLSLCAERNAMFQMHLKGYQKDDVELLAVIGQSKDPISPCGSCRQVMAELLNADTPVILFNLNGEEKITSVGDLLPYGFGNKDLG